MKLLQIKTIIFKLIIELFVLKKKRPLVRSRWTKKQIKKYIDCAVKETKIPEFTDKDSKKIIWQYWHQGIENAPPLIQKCIESVKKYHPDYDIKILSFETIKDYVQIPEKYYELLEQKRIPIAIFSDILRLYLLTTYGGTWIDATLYFTDRIPQKILDSDFCVVQKDPLTDAFEDNMSCYFIHANKDSKWIHLTKNALENYWNENNFLIHYFIFEHVVTMISESTSELQDNWAKMEYISSEDVTYFRRFLYTDYNLELHEEIKNKTFMHKLSYKIIKDGTYDNSFYDKIINNEI